MKYAYVFVPTIIVCIIALFIFLKSNAVLRKVKFDLTLSGIIFGGLIAIYALILAFVVIVVWQQYQTTGDRIEVEASSLFNVSRSTRAFNDSLNKPIAMQIRAEIDSYYLSVINDEWPLMASGKLDNEEHTDTTLDRKTRNLNKDIWHSIFKLIPVNEAQKQWHNAIIKNMLQYSEARHFRMANKDYHIPPVMWWMLVSGAVLVILFSMFLESNNDWYHGIKVLMISLMIIFSMLLVNMLNHPFNGMLQLKPNAFKKDRIILGNW